MAQLTTCTFCRSTLKIDPKAVLDARHAGEDLYCDDACREASRSRAIATVRAMDEPTSPDDVSSRRPAITWYCRQCGCSTTNPLAASALASCHCGSNHWSTAKPR